MKNKLKRAVPLISIIPLILGTSGYIIEGERITDSLYASFALYFTSPVSDAYNLLIELARWTAPLVMATVILYAVKTIWDDMCWSIQCLSPNSVAVYCDSDMRISFDKKIKAIYPGRNFKPNAKSHIIMLDSDMDSLNFYEKNKTKLINGSVYIGLKEMECGLMKENSEVTFFDVNGSIADVLWKHISIWEKNNERLTISIYGEGGLSENILNYGLLMNLYSVHQEITYNLIGAHSYYQARHGDINTYNRDCVHYYGSDDELVWNIIEHSDIVIVAEEPLAEKLQTIGALCRDGEIYYYSPKEGSPAEYLQFTNMKPFGRNEDILTDENIRHGKLTEKAIKLNCEYAKKYHTEEAWGKLNGFLRWSNISSADFNEVLEYLIKSRKNTDTESLAELEHIRWCRFHWLNYWEYGIPEDGGSKDESRKIHKCLCKYSELSEADKDKDRAVVETARKSCEA